MDNPLSAEEQERLLKEYQSTIDKKIQNLNELTLSVQQSLTSKNLDALQRALHKLAGSAGTYGYVQASQICRKWELDIDAQIKAFPPSSQWLSRLSQLVLEVKKAFYANQK